MRDVLIITPTDQSTASWNLDIDIIDGVPDYVQEEGNTADQRAALASVMMKGTIPGLPDEGVAWSDMYNSAANDTDIVTIDNQVKKSIQNNVASGSYNNSYTPVYSHDKKGNISVGIYKAGGLV